MKPTACLLMLAASLGAAHLALAQGGGQKTPAPAVIEILGADMAPSCKDGDVDRARKLAAACNGKKQCRFDPEESDAVSESCFRESLALWSCGDGKTREAALAPQPGQSRAISLECLQPAATMAAAAPLPASAQPDGSDKTETVKVEESKRPVTAAARPQKVEAKVTEAGLAAEMLREQRAAAENPANTGSGEERAAAMRGGLWSRPDHSPDSTLHSPGQ